MSKKPRTISYQYAKGADWLKIQPYGTHLAVIVGEDDWKKFSKLYNQDSVELKASFGGVTQLTENQDTGDWFIYVYIKDASYGEFTLAVHEAVHVVQFLFERIGERLPGVETEAYLTEHVAKFIFEAIEHRGKQADAKTD